jgi:hypothetical protein
MTQGVGIPFHPLFTLETDMSDPEQVKEAEQPIAFINVQRMQGGHYQNAGRLYEASELNSLETFVGEFGGGSFLLLGRGPDNRGIVKRASLKINEQEYPPRFAAVAGRLPPVATAAGLPAPPPVAAAPSMMGMPMAEFAAFMNMMRPPAPTDNSAVLVALINSMSESSRATMQMISVQSAENLKAQVELVRALQTQPTGGDNPAAIQTSFMNGIRSMGEILREMKDKDGGDQPLNWDTLLSIADRVMGSIGQARDIIREANGGAGSSPAAEVAPPASTEHTVPVAA